MPERVPNKHQYLADSLTVRIQSGEFQPGSRLPSDRALAAEFGVSYVTARRGVNLLVDAGLAQRCGRRGTYVRNPGTPASKRVARKLNIICTAYPDATHDRFISDTLRECRERGLESAVIRVPEGEERTAASTISKPELCVVRMNEYYAWPRITRAVVAAADRSVIVGSRLDDRGVSSVMGHDTDGIAVAIDHLAHLGHTGIGFVMHHPNLPLARLRLASWRTHVETLSPMTAADGPIIVDIPPYGSQAEAAYEAVTQRLEDRGRKRQTALVCVNGELALGAMAACRDAGFSVPQHVSILSLASSDSTQFAEPPVTTVEIDLRQEVRAAFELLMARSKGRLPVWDRLRLVEPRLYERASTASIRSITD